MKQTGLMLQLDAAVKPNFRKWAVSVCAAVLVGSVLALCLLPAARTGGKFLANRLFAASEAVNAYRYDFFAVPDQASALPAALLLGLALAALLVLAALLHLRAVPLGLAFALAGAEAYFGLTLPPAIQVLLFALLGLGLVQGTVRSRLPLLAAAAGIFLLVSWLAPGVHARLELRSEAVRDALAPVEQLLGGSDSKTPEEQPLATRRENRLNPEGADGTSDDARNDRLYQHLQQQEQQISRPKRIHYLKIALLAVLILALLTVPFLPFVLYDARRRKALARRAAFASPVYAEAIRAMFAHLNAYLICCGKDGGNRPFSQWVPELERSMPPGYAERYAQGSALFREAAYSTHTMTEAQRDTMQALLLETEQILYQEADLRTRLRLRFAECLQA